MSTRPCGHVLLPAGGHDGAWARTDTIPDAGAGANLAGPHAGVNRTPAPPGEVPQAAVRPPTRPGVPERW
jgi:hypothetical protein